MVNLSTAEESALASVAATLGVPRDALFNLILFESGWNPRAINPISGARGLIQFMHATARGMGFPDADALIRQYPDRISQLRGPVYRYLTDFKPYSGTPQDLFMAVFYPKARAWPSYQRFPDSVIAQNPGVNTPGDYVRKVYTRAGLRYVAPGLVLILAGAALYFFVIRGKV